ncbi:MAG: FkbM family methyltransferase [Armatimonadetes bacterium]|nr:FkbM family methyltransferase [Armatimonadota bacterium]
MLSEVGAHRFFVDSSDEGIGRSVFLSGAFEHEWAEKVFNLLKSLNCADFQGKTLIDVGANIGTTCIPAIRQHGFAHALAFEPAPRSFALLQYNIINNGLQDAISAFQIALSSENGDVPFEFAPLNPGDNRVRMVSLPQGADVGPERDRESQREVIHVAARTFDSLVDEGVIPLTELGLVWMDAQGHEGHILKGAQSLLRSPVPVLTEFWPYGLRRAGGLALLEEIIASHYTHFVDTRAAETGERRDLVPASEVWNLKEKYPEEKYQDMDSTDLLLVKL